MMITNLEAVKFSNEQVRPISEKMRNLYYECKSMESDWYNGVNAMIPNDEAEILEDNRPSDSDLSGADITNMAVQVAGYIAMIEQTGVLNIIAKPCVRAFKAQ